MRIFNDYENYQDNLLTSLKIYSISIKKVPMIVEKRLRRLWYSTRLFFFYIPKMSNLLQKEKGKTTLKT